MKEVEKHGKYVLYFYLQQDILVDVGEGVREGGDHCVVDDHKDHVLNLLGKAASHLLVFAWGEGGLHHHILLVCADDGKAILVFKLDLLEHLDGRERTTNEHVSSLPV